MEMCDRKYMFGDKSSFGSSQNDQNMSKKCENGSECGIGMDCPDVRVMPRFISSLLFIESEFYSQKRIYSHNPKIMFIQSYLLINVTFYIFSYEFNY